MPATACQRDPQHCRCVEHEDGLAAYARDRKAYDAALDRIRPLRLRIVTAGPDRRPQCNGTMTCPCEDCGRARITRPALGAGPAQFKVRPARRRAA